MDLSNAFALPVTSHKAVEICHDEGFFQAMRAVLAKGGGRKRKPDEQEKATQTVLQQAELLCANWSG